MIVFTLPMPRIKGMVAEHVERLLRQIILGDMINVFVMSPGKLDLVQAAAFLVNAKSRLIAGIVAVRIVREELEEHNLVRITTTRWVRVTHDGPLRFAPEAKHLAEIVDHARQNEPARVAVGADLLSRLQQVLELREIGVRVAV